MIINANCFICNTQFEIDDNSHYVPGNDIDGKRGYYYPICDDCYTKAQDFRKDCE